MWQWPIATIAWPGVRRRLGQRPGLLVEQGDALQVGRIRIDGVGAFFRRRRTRHVAGPQEGNRHAPGLHVAIAAGQRHQQAFQVDLALAVAHHVADHARAVGGQQRSRRFQAAGRIVVAGDDDDVERRRPRACLLQEVVQLALRGRRRVGVVEDVAGDQQRVDLFGHDGIEQPVEEAFVFPAPVEIVQGLAEVPVGSVQQPHGWVGKDGERG
jgi:hypothetical protein